MKNILVIHSHNANRGDEAAVKAMVDELLMEFPDAAITISNNGFVPYPNMDERVRQISRLPKLESKIAQIEFFLILFTNGKVAFTREAKEFLAALKKADLVIHAPGGPSIGDTYYSAEKLYLWRLDLVRKIGKPYMFYAPSMGPFNDAGRNKKRKLILEGASAVLVRDPISKKYVENLLPNISVDLALDSALQHDINEEQNNHVYDRYNDLKGFLSKHKKCIGITITDLKWHPIHKSEEIINFIPQIFEEFIVQKTKEGYGIIFIPQLYGNLNDTILMSRFMLNEHTFMMDAFTNERDTYFQQYVIGRLYAVVGMRYHSNIFSAKMGTPFVSISYEQKMTGFMQAINETDYCIDLQELSYDKLQEKFSMLESNYMEYKQSLMELHEYMKHESHKSTDKVVSLFKEMNQ